MDINTTASDVILPISPLSILTFINPFISTRGYLGQLEKMVKGAKNKGFQSDSFDAMMRSVGWRSGDAWCAYFTKLIYMQFYSFDRDYISKNFTGSSVGNADKIKDLNRAGDNRYIFVAENSPQVADIFCMRNANGQYQGHVGLVTEIINSTTVKTIEGNTNLKGSREGDGVFQLSRTLIVGNVSGSKKFTGYIRRNFTPDELNRLSFDESLQTLIFK